MIVGTDDNVVAARIADLSKASPVLNLENCAKFASFDCDSCRALECVECN